MAELNNDNNEELMEFDTLLITGNDDKEHELAIMDKFEYSGKNYIVLSQVVGDEIQEDEFLYAYHEEDGEIVLDNIEDDVEFDTVSKFYAEQE